MLFFLGRTLGNVGAPESVDTLLASLKPAFDRIADARVVTNDSGMIHMPVEQYVDRPDPRVEIVVEAMA